MKFMDAFKDDVNNFLFIDNTTSFLKMAYEEVLYPFLLAGKKKYMGIQHLQIVNLFACTPEITLEEFMKSKSIFTKGFEIIKRGVSDFLKIIFYNIIKQAFCLTETRTLKEICEQALGDIHSTKWDPQLFAKTKRYKLPGTKPDGTKAPGNVTVLKFIEKMKNIKAEYPELQIRLPEIGTRYKYVNVKRYPYKYNMKGTKQPIGAYERHEFLNMLDNIEYKKIVGDLEIDLDYYVKHELIGQLARLVIYHNQYDPFSNTAMDDDELKIADEKSMNNARKILTLYYDEHHTTSYQNRSHIHQKIYKDVSKIAHDKITRQYNMTDNIYEKITSKNISVYVEGKSSILDKNIKDDIIKIIDKNTDIVANNLKKAIPKAKLIKNLELIHNSKLENKDNALFIKFIHGKSSIINNLLKRLFENIIKTRIKISKYISKIQEINMKDINNIENSINKINTMCDINNMGIEPNKKEEIVFTYDKNIIENIINVTIVYNDDVEEILTNFNNLCVELIYYKLQAKRLRVFSDAINKKRVNIVKNDIGCITMREIKINKTFEEKFYQMFKNDL